MAGALRALGHRPRNPVQFDTHQSCFGGEWLPKILSRNGGSAVMSSARREARAIPAAGLSAAEQRSNAHYAAPAFGQGQFGLGLRCQSCRDRCRYRLRLPPRPRPNLPLPFRKLFSVNTLDHLSRICGREHARPGRGGIRPRVPSYERRCAEASLELFPTRQDFPRGAENCARGGRAPHSLRSEDDEPSQPAETDDGPLIAGPFFRMFRPQRLSPLASIPAIRRITDADSVTVFAKLCLFSSYAFAPRHFQT